MIYASQGIRKDVHPVSMTDIDANSLQWTQGVHATTNGAIEDGKADDTADGIVPNEGDAPIYRDKTTDRAAGTIGADDHADWGATYPGAKVGTKAHAAAAAAAGHNNGSGTVAVDVVGTVHNVETIATDWTPVHLNITANVQQVLGRQPNRRTLTLSNVGANVVYIANDNPTCNATSGLALNAGDSVELPSQGPVYAVCAADLSSVLAGFITYDTGAGS